MVTLHRAKENPIILPSNTNVWEQRAAFNVSVVKVDGIFHAVYRALSPSQYYQGHELSLSTIGYAQSKDGIHFTDHKQLIKPDFVWELFGCEDPRVTYMDGKFYIFYTALSNYPFNAEGIKVAVAITRDFKTIDEKHLVTPFNAKAMALLPEKIDGKMVAVLTANTDIPPSKIGFAYFDNEEEIWNPNYWKNWYAYVDDHSLQLLRDGNDQVEVGTAPIKTEHGWLLIHSYIKNYHSDQKIFGIEAALLDPTNLRNVIGRSEHPLMVPETDYERFGDVPNIVFPSGGLIDREKLYVYYGAADTTSCVATCDLDVLLHNIYPPEKRKMRETPEQVLLKRFEENPILTAHPDHGWEKKAVFNPAAVYEEGMFHILYRAMSDNNVSTFGYASSRDGFHIETRLPDPVYVPRENFERDDSGNNSGCEDPRLTRIRDRFYVLYTAYDGHHVPRVAMSSISVDDFFAQRWHWAIPKLISPPDRDDKDACIFPKEINGKYAIIHRLESAIWIDYVHDLHFYEGEYLAGKIIMEKRPDKWDNGRIGISSVPLETEKGWLTLYHGIDDRDNHTYKVGVALLELHNPSNVISRLDYPIFEPEMKYEKEGQVPNVVFPCGAAIKDDTLYVYYGGADSTLGVATASVSKLLKALLK